MKIGMARNAAPKKSHHHTPVTEPTDSEISLFERHLEMLLGKKKHPKILIVGPSPELRSLAAKFGLRTTVVANDLEVIERTAKLMKRRNENERWLEGDLTSLPLKKNEFDVIFGDHIVSNAPPYNSEKFYRKMREILKRGGTALFRSIVFTKTEKPFEKKVTKYFRIVDKKLAKRGVFAEHFPIYLVKPKR